MYRTRKNTLVVGLIAVAMAYFTFLSFSPEVMLITRNFKQAHRTSDDMFRIVLHWTANKHKNADWDNTVSYFEQTDRSASVHYVADYNEVGQCVDEEDIAWHTGDRWGNKVSLGIEMCANFKTKSDSMKLFYNMLPLLSDLHARYPKAIVVRHHDFEKKKRWGIYKKNCPIWFTKNEYQTQAEGDQKFIYFLSQVDSFNLTKGVVSHIADSSAALLGIPMKPQFDIKQVR